MLYQEYTGQYELLDSEMTRSTYIEGNSIRVTVFPLEACVDAQVVLEAAAGENTDEGRSPDSSVQFSVLA